MKKFALSAALFATVVSGNGFAEGSAVTPVAADQDWAGYYVGAELGGGWTTEKYRFLGSSDPFFPIDEVFATFHGLGSTVTSGGVFDQNSSGVAGGVKLGKNWQFGSWVLGLETAFDGVDFSTTTVRSHATYNTSIDWLYTVTPRFGFAYAHFLFFGKLGVGLTQEKSNLNTTTAPLGSFSQSHDTLGVDVGAGVDYVLRRHWVMGLDYDYIDFGSTPYGGAITNGVGSTSYAIDSTFNIVTASVSYLFNT